MKDLAHPTTLLLVDDDPSIVRLLTRVIERSFRDQIEIQSLTNPLEARKCIDNKLFDVLITDLEMPDINGLELLRLAKRRNPCTQVFFITAHSTFEALLDALEMGASDYLLKPIDQVELVELLNQAQARHQRWKGALAGTITHGRSASAHNCPEFDTSS